MDSEEGEPGTVVWAKLAGFALWPARLAKLSEVSPTVSKAKRGTRQQLVYFFGSYDYAWVSQIQPWDENYEKNIKGSKAKAFAKGLKEARQWLTARKHVFPVYQAHSSEDEDEDSRESESESASDGSSDEERSTSKRGVKRTAKGKQVTSNQRKGRDGEVAKGKLAKKDEASEGDAEGRRNAKKRRLEQRQTERQARDSDPEAMKRRDKRHAIQRRLGLCPPAGIREIVHLQRERKTREEEKEAVGATEKEKRKKQTAKEKEEDQKKKKKGKEHRKAGKDEGLNKKKKDRTGKRDTKRKRDKENLGDKKERPTKVARKGEHC